MTNIPFRVGLQQRMLPSYRADFFDLLASSCTGGLSVFAGLPRSQEAVETARSLKTAQYVQAGNIHLLSGPAYFCWQTGLRGWLEQWNPEVLIMEANPRYLSSPAAERWMHTRRRPVIGWGLGAPAMKGTLARFQEAARSRFLCRFDGLITYSRQGAEEYAAAGFPAERIFIARNAAARKPVSPAPQRNNLLPEQKPMVVYVGRLQARKRIDLLLQACAALPVPPRLVIVGDGPVRGELETLAKNVFPTAEFPGALRGEALAPVLTAADLFVLPGTGGLAVQEAMSYALPVMVAEGDGTQSDLVRPENGWTLPPGDGAALAAAMQTALADISRLRQMGAESYRIVSEEINLETMVASFSDAIRAAHSLYSHF